MRGQTKFPASELEPRMEQRQNASFPFLSSLIAILIAIIYLLLRYPLETEYTVVIRILGTSLFFLNAPFTLYLRLIKRRSIDFSSFNITVIICLLIVMMVAGMLNITFLSYPIAALGAAGFCSTVYYYLGGFSGPKIFSVLMASTMVLWLAGSVWEGRMLTPLTFEKIISGFYDNPKDLNYGLDNLYHMSLAQMIKTYDTPSTGLDELPYIPYHFGSHFLFAHLSQFINVSVREFYNIGFPIIFLPLFFHLAFIIFHQFRRLAGSKVQFDIYFWALALTIFVGFLSIDRTGYAYRTGLAWNSLVKSESYLISLMLLITYLSIFLPPLLREKAIYPSWSQLILLVLLLVPIGLCKISTLFILDVIIGYCFLRFRLFRSLKANIIVVCAVITSVCIAYLLHDPKGPGGSFSFLHFYKTFIYSRFHFFIALYFLWTFVLIGVCTVLRILRVPFNTILLEIQIIIAVIGFLPGMLVRIEGGSAHYFSDIQHWTAFFFLAYYSSILLEQFRKSRAMLRLSFAFAAILIVLSGANCFYSLTVVAKDNYVTKESILGKEIRPIETVSTAEILRHRSTFFTHDLNAALASNDDFRKLKALSRLDTVSQKQNRILYVEDEEWLEKYLQCYKYPFLLTAITGIALLDGYSLTECHWGGYGVEYYQDPKSMVAEKDLCGLVKNPIFQEIILYNIDHASYKTIPCMK